MQLHWLLVKPRVMFEICLITYYSVNIVKVSLNGNRKKHCLLAYLFTYLQLLTYLLININSRLHSVIINYTFCKLHCSAPSITISLHVVAG